MVQPVDSIIKLCTALDGSQESKEGKNSSLLTIEFFFALIKHRLERATWIKAMIFHVTLTLVDSHVATKIHHVLSKWFLSPTHGLVFVTLIYSLWVLVGSSLFLPTYS